MLVVRFSRANRVLCPSRAIPFEGVPGRQRRPLAVWAKVSSAYFLDYGESPGYPPPAGYRESFATFDSGRRVLSLQWGNTDYGIIQRVHGHYLVAGVFFRDLEFLDKLPAYRDAGFGDELDLASLHHACLYRPRLINEVLLTVVWGVPGLSNENRSYLTLALEWCQVDTDLRSGDLEAKLLVRHPETRKLIRQRILGWLKAYQAADFLKYRDCRSMGWRVVGLEALIGDTWMPWRLDRRITREEEPATEAPRRVIRRLRISSPGQIQ